MPWKMTDVASVTMSGNVRIRVTIKPFTRPSTVPSAKPMSIAAQTGKSQSTSIMPVSTPTSDI